MLESTLNVKPSCCEDQQLEHTCDLIALELLTPVEEVRTFARVLGKQSPEKLSCVSKKFDVSLRVAAGRLIELGLWKWPMGMWRCDPSPRELWFVGKRPWPTNCPSFAIFEQTMATKEAICANEHFSNGMSTQPVALKAYHIGKNYVLAMAAVSRL
jgi:hypothetical protein